VPRIIITPGEPAGIGPDITLRIAEKAWDAELVVVCDPDLLLSRASLLQTPIELSIADLTKPFTNHRPGILKIIPVKLGAPCQVGELNPDNASYVIRCLEIATQCCLKNEADALVTGPVQKSVLNAANIPFMGHTEFLAAQCGVSDVVMLFVVNSLKVALLTTHIPLKHVPDMITHDTIFRTVTILHNELQSRFGITQPRILLCGLNPHAGENGYLGREEMDIIQPAVEILRNKNINILGPLPADTIFTEKYLKSADAILAMYHDQALPVVKYIGFNHAVNVTLGLPIIRTSVDHGTALDIAGTQNADTGSLIEAIRLAIELAKRKNL
jgi:4-hydroxythreonine-4-phosphate dehydrogenase